MYKMLLLSLFFFISIIATAQSADSIFVTNAALNSTDSVQIFEQVEVEAQFPGGLPAWRTYLMQNMRMDKIAAAVPRKQKHWEQQAIVQFIVGKDGSISGIKVINSVSPQWEPAMQNGRPVKAYRKQPITFVVSSD
jgi:protein TonB